VVRDTDQQDMYVLYEIQELVSNLTYIIARNRDRRWQTKWNAKPTRGCRKHQLIASRIPCKCLTGSRTPPIKAQLTTGELVQDIVAKR
jgi:hypothetical protein